MPEETVLNLNYLWRELVKVGIVLQRPAVQIQLLGLALSILLGMSVFKLSWPRLKRRFPVLSQVEMGKSKLSGWQFFAALVRYLLAPTIILIAVGLLEIGFEQLGWVRGYLRNGISLALFIWFYCLFLVSLYALFPVDSINHYRNRLLRSLFYLIAIGTIMSWFLELPELYQVTFMHLFGGAVTLGSAFVGD